MAEFKASTAPSTDRETVLAGDAEEYVDAVLEGGPAAFPANERRRLARRHEVRIKVPFYGGHEHFERVDGQQRPVVYRWITRTRVAE